MKKQEVEKIIKELDEYWTTEKAKTENYTKKDWDAWKKEHTNSRYMILNFLTKKGMTKGDINYWGSFLIKNSKSDAPVNLAIDGVDYYKFFRGDLTKFN